MSEQSPKSGGLTPEEGRQTAVLVIDDEEMIRRLLRRVLQQHHIVAEAATVEEGMRKLAEEHFEVVLCDIRISQESGLELLRFISGGVVDTAVVMVTGVDDPRVAQEALALGAYGYLLKPFTPNQVIITVASALRRRELERDRAHAEAQQRVHELTAERERIATELHQTVINHLFGIELGLTGALRHMEGAEAISRVHDAVDRLDETIRQIRTTILCPPEG